VTIFFLAQITPLNGGASPQPDNLIPPAKVAPSIPDTCFRQIYGIVYGALYLYKLDAINRFSKDYILSEWGKESFCFSGVQYDIKNMDIGRKGWTRYYPFQVGNNNFIVRVFRTEERAYQPKIDVLFEGEIENPAVTFQVLPNLNSILKDCRIKPHTAYPYSRNAATSP
jgi:hypothetical protein